MGKLERRVNYHFITGSGLQGAKDTATDLPSNGWRSEAPDPDEEKEEKRHITVGV